MHDKIEKTFGSNRFEVCEVKDFSEAGAYNEAVKGEWETLNRLVTLQRKGYDKLWDRRFG